MKILLSFIILALILGCTPDLEDAERFPYDVKSWDRINYRAAVGEGNNEIEKNRDKQVATKEIEMIKDRLFYTDRVAFRIEDWQNKSNDLYSWANVPEGTVASWTYNLLDGEPRAGTYLPWLIGDYNFETNSFEIWPAPFDCLTGSSGIKIYITYTRCFGDPPPTIDTEKEGSAYYILSYKDNWAWYSDEVLQINMNESQAEEFISTIGHSHIGLRVYYKYYSSSDNAIIVSVKGYIQNGEIRIWLFTTEYHDDKTDDTIYRAGGSDSYYWSKFVF